MLWNWCHICFSSNLGQKQEMWCKDVKKIGMSVTQEHNKTNSNHEILSPGFVDNKLIWVKHTRWIACMAPFLDVWWTQERADVPDECLPSRNCLLWRGSGAWLETDVIIMLLGHKCYFKTSPLQSNYESALKCCRLPGKLFQFLKLKHISIFHVM